MNTLNAATAQGTSVVQTTSTSGTDQNWTLVAAGQGLYKIVNQKSGLLLGVDQMSTASGAQVFQWSDNGTADHLWRLTAR
ncbi:RICIN domain-containing protein [Streptomyces sp. cg40]|uniref:RICIN domain-containing protein n=1 Tax=Streptomyces sp. cg40 TaxID=3419764 RepID=UPI003D02EB95